MSVVTPAVSVAHVRTLLADVDVIQGPLILLAVVVLDPTEPGGAGPEHRLETEDLFIGRTCACVCPAVV